MHTILKGILLKDLELHFLLNLSLFASLLSNLWLLFLTFSSPALLSALNIQVPSLPLFILSVGLLLFRLPLRFHLSTLPSEYSIVFAPRAGSLTDDFRKNTFGAWIRKNRQPAPICVTIYHGTSISMTERSKENDQWSNNLEVKNRKKKWLLMSDESDLNSGFERLESCFILQHLLASKNIDKDSFEPCRKIDIFEPRLFTNYLPTKILLSFEFSMQFDIFLNS